VDYATARQKLKKSEVTSDLTSESEIEKRKRKKPKRFEESNSGSSGEEDKNQTTLNFKFPAPSRSSAVISQKLARDNAVPINAQTGGESPDTASQQYLPLNSPAFTQPKDKRSYGAAINQNASVSPSEREEIGYDYVLQDLENVSDSRSQTLTPFVIAKKSQSNTLCGCQGINQLLIKSISHDQSILRGSTINYAILTPVT